MAIKTLCPHCSQSYSLADAQLGKKVRCKSCGEPFLVEDEAPRKAPARVRDDDADDRRRPREVRRKSGGIPVWVWIVGGIGAAVLLLGCAGGGLIIWIASSGSLGNKLTEENYKKIKIGMTPAEVKSILGEPNQDINATQQLKQMGADPSTGHRLMVWKNGNNQIVLTFNSSDKLINMSASFVNADGGLRIRGRN